MKARLHSILLSIILCIFLAACGSTATTPTTATSTAAPITLNVFAAASLTEAFNEIATNYQAAHPGIKIKYNFNGSQILVQQIINGAPADIFASADQANMKKASDAGIVGSAQIFAKNRLVVIVPVDNPGKIMTLKDLARKGVKIDITAPAVPAGKYSLQVLDNMGQAPAYGPAYVSAVKANFVSQEENVKAVVQKVQLGEVDAGFVYLTDVTTQVASKLKMLDIPNNFNVIAQYPIAVVKNSAHTTEAQAFVQYLLAAQGQTILQKYHFVSVNG